MASKSYHVQLDGEREYLVEIVEEDGRTWALIDGERHAVDLCETFTPQTWVGLVDDAPHELTLTKGEGGEACLFRGRTWQVEVEEERLWRLRRMSPGAGPATAGGDVVSPIAGVVVAILVAPGVEVKKGQPLVVVDAMKMENRISTPRDATVRCIEVKQGERIKAGQVLVKL